MKHTPKTMLDQLPSELLLMIVDEMDRNSYVAFTRTCRRFATLLPRDKDVLKKYPSIYYLVVSTPFAFFKRYFRLYPVESFTAEFIRFVEYFCPTITAESFINFIYRERLESRVQEEPIAGVLTCGEIAMKIYKETGHCLIGGIRDDWRYEVHFPFVDSETQSFCIHMLSRQRDPGPLIRVLKSLPESVREEYLSELPVTKMMWMEYESQY